MEEGSVDSRAQFLLRLQRLIDLTLEDLDRELRSKDSDEKEARAIRSQAAKLIRILDKATASYKSNSRFGLEVGQTAEKASETETREE